MARVFTLSITLKSSDTYTYFFFPTSTSNVLMYLLCELGEVLISPFGRHPEDLRLCGKEQATQWFN